MLGRPYFKFTVPPEHRVSDVWDCLRLASVWYLKVEFEGGCVRVTRHDPKLTVADRLGFILVFNSGPLLPPNFSRKLYFLCKPPELALSHAGWPAEVDHSSKSICLQMFRP
ncbi:hypothetical protein CBL_07490 [Carabus blaptoides fortunei]